MQVTNKLSKVLFLNKAIDKKLWFFASIAFVFLAFFASNFLSPLSGSICFSLFWYACRALPLKAAVFYSFLGSAVLEFIKLSWLCSIKYQGIYIVILYVILVALIALEFAMVSYLVLRKERLSFLNILQISALSFLFEWSRLYWMSGFTWSYMGEALANHLWTSQIASIIGIYGLTFFLLFLNLLFYRGFCGNKKSLYGALALLLFINGFGYFRVSHSAPMEAIEEMEVTLVHTSLKPSQKMPLIKFRGDFLHPIEQWRRIFELIKTAEYSSNEWLVFPETTVCYCYDEAICSLSNALYLLKSCFYGDLTEYLPPNDSPFVKTDGKGEWVSNAFFAQFLSNYLKVNLLAGFDEKAEGGFGYYNSVYLFSDGNIPRVVHRKNILLPVAEYLPFEWCKKIAYHYGIKEFFIHGKQVCEQDASFAVNICLEDTYANFIRRQRLKGAKVFFNLTNDAWYPNSSLASRHYQISKLRAVENGVFSLRATNCGVTAIIDPYGRELKKINFNGNKEGLVKDKIKVYHLKTFFTEWGDFPLLIFSFSLLSVVTPSLIKKLLSLKLFC